MRVAALLALALLSGCASMTPAQKKWTSVAVGMLVVGAIAAHQAESREPASPAYQPRVCDSRPDACR
jgi:hypothetical protein